MGQKQEERPLKAEASPPASPGGFLLRVSASLETYVRGSAFSLT